MSVPRELTLQTVGGDVRADGPHRFEQLKKLRKRGRYRPCVHAAAARDHHAADRGRSGDTLEIMAKFRARDAEKFGLNVRVGNGERTVIGYDVDRGGVYLDRTRSGNVGFSASFPSTEFAPLKLTERLRHAAHLGRPILGRGVRATADESPSPTRCSRDRDSQGIQLFSTGGRAQLEDLTIWKLRSTWK